VSGKSYRVSLESDSLSPTLARWLVPGKIHGGSLAGALVLEGDGKAPVRAASGRFDLRNATYTVPDHLELLGEPAAVSRFSGEYRWQSGRTELTRMVIATGLLNGSGSLTVEDGSGVIQANLATADLGRVADFWPTLAGKFEGGAGTGALNARFDDTGVRGTLALKNTGGTLVLPSAPAEYAQHPVEKASMVLGFEPEKLTFTDVKVRGPKGNLDGEGAWSATGPVYAEGKAWFSKDYTSKLIKPSGWGWLAKLVGIREIKSDFTLTGTADEVTLNADITRSLLWKFAKGRVPKEFQAIASGKSPLWVKPVEVAEAEAAGAAPATGGGSDGD
jgi:hypothetical protein